MTASTRWRYRAKRWLNRYLGSGRPNQKRGDDHFGNLVRLTRTPESGVSDPLPEDTHIVSWSKKRPRASYSIQHLVQHGSVTQT